MTRVEAPCRLHFGLLCLPVPGQEHWPDGLPVRQFGGVGLMIDSPCIALSVAPASFWSAHGPNAGRALVFAQTFLTTLPLEKQRPFRLEVECCPEEHTGLGSGTALALAVAKALAAETGHAAWTSMELAQRVGRGTRSAVGIHGFEHGGLIVEAGKRPGERISPLVGRYAFPKQWRILLARPAASAPIWYGQREQQAFAQLTRNNATEALCRIVLTGLLPALAAQDLAAFGAALHEYNVRAGEAFAAGQGGMYASPVVAEMVKFLRSKGICGVGQSSWGPTVFAVVENEESAIDIQEHVGRERALPPSTIVITQGAARGARLESQA